MAIRRFLLIFGAVALFAMPFSGLAQTMETTPVPIPPKPDFSTMQFLMGSWACHTTSSRRPAPYVSTSTYAMSPDGWFINETTVQDPVPWFNQKITSYDKITYDPQTKRWVDVTYGDLGNYGFTTSPGWDGNKMVWHDPTFAPTADVKSQTDATMTKDSAAKTTTTSSFTEASGRSIAVVATCVKNR